MRGFFVLLCLLSFIIASEGRLLRRERNRGFGDFIENLLNTENNKDDQLVLLENKLKEKNKVIGVLQDQLKKSEQKNFKLYGECKENIESLEASYIESLSQRNNKITILKNRIITKDDKLNQCTAKLSKLETKVNGMDCTKVTKTEIDKQKLMHTNVVNELQARVRSYGSQLLEKQKTIDNLLSVIQELQETMAEQHNAVEKIKSKGREDSLTVASLTAIIKLQRQELKQAKLPKLNNTSELIKQLEDCKANLTSINEEESTKDNQISELQNNLSISQQSQERLHNTILQMEQQFQEKEASWVDDIKTLEKKLNIAENRLKEKEDKLQHVVSKVQKKCQAEINKIASENADLQSKINELQNSSPKQNEKVEEQTENTNEKYKSLSNKKISHHHRVAMGFLNDDECRSVCDENVNCKAYCVDTISGICFYTEEPIKQAIVDSIRSSMSFNIFKEQNVWIKLDSK